MIIETEKNKIKNRKCKRQFNTNRELSDYFNLL